MDMSAHLLTSRGRAECSYYRDLGCTHATGRPGIAPQQRVEIGWGRLVVVDAVQTKAERLHDDTANAVKV